MKEEFAHDHTIAAEIIFVVADVAVALVPDIIINQFLWNRLAG